MLDIISASYTQVENLRDGFIQLDVRHPETVEPKWWERLFHHGNYMGSSWNDGRYQRSFEFHTKLPVDYGDYRSMLHDDAYAAANRHGGDVSDALSKADKVYFESMMGRGNSVVEVVRNSLAGEVVGLQGEARSFLKKLGITI